MNIVYALQPLRKSIFLAGPTPRSSAVPSWRPYALSVLKRLGFDGDVYVPEAMGWSPHSNYNAQIDWEWGALDRSATIVFWIPRELETMPAFTTNVEFGMAVATGKVLLGFPDNAPKTKYLHALADRFGTPVFNDLDVMLAAAVART